MQCDSKYQTSFPCDFSVIFQPILTKSASSGRGRNGLYDAFSVLPQEYCHAVFSEWRID